MAAIFSLLDEDTILISGLLEECGNASRIFGLEIVKVLIAVKFVADGVKQANNVVVIDQRVVVKTQHD